jgi:quercetin dioxygenase-like cupin family protein
MPLWEEKGAAWHEVLPGVRRRILVQGEGLTFVMYRIDPGRVFPLHTHPHVQAGVFLEGGGEFRVGEETWTMKEGSSYLVASNVPHELRTDPTRPSVILDVFRPERADFGPEVVPPDRP